VITYLNKEVNEAQLGRRQFGGGSTGAGAGSLPRPTSASLPRPTTAPLPRPASGGSAGAGALSLGSFSPVTYKSRAAMASASTTTKTADRLVEGGEGLLLGAGALAALQRSVEQDDDLVGGGGASSLLAGSVSQHVPLSPG